MAYAIQVPFFNDKLFVMDVPVGGEPEILLYGDYDVAFNEAQIWKDKDGNVVGEVVPYYEEECFDDE